MNAIYSLVFVFALVLIPLFGVGAAQQTYFFGVCVPWTAFLIFLVGFTAKILKWASRPVPFSIPTTGGQQWSTLDMVQHDKYDNPATTGQVWIRMILEVFAFRSLFRNTSVMLGEKDGKPVVGYASSKWLWLFALMFHYSFFTIAVRHLRLFLNPVPKALEFLETMDGLLQIGIPRLYLTDMVIVAAVLFLLLRRVGNPAVRYISQVADYFPLLLILAVAASGIYMRYYAKVDVVAIKQFVLAMVTLGAIRPIPTTIDISFFIHLFLVSTLILYFPFSKLMHLGGVFLSPTRNMPNDSRYVRHVNPWNDPNIKPHSYEAYENDFRAPMIEAGLPVEKEA